MPAKIISIRNNEVFIRNYYTKWEFRLKQWSQEDIKRGGGWLRGNPRNIRPHRDPRNVAHLRWYKQLEQTYRLKARIDLITHSINNPHF